MTNKLSKGNKYIDTNLLLSKLSLNGYTKSSFATACGVSRSTVTNIFNKDIRVDNELMSKMFELLSLSASEASDIFFKPNLRITKVIKPMQTI